MTLVNMVVVVATVGPLPGLDKASEGLYTIKIEDIIIVHQDNNVLCIKQTKHNQYHVLFSYRK